MGTFFAVVALALLIGVPLWFATRPFKNPKQRFSSDNLTDDKTSNDARNFPNDGQG